MLLAIDAGNTNIVFAVHDGEEMRAQWRAVTQTTRTADEYAVCCSQLLALQGLSFADLDARHHRHRGAGGPVRSAPASAATISNASRWWSAIRTSTSASRSMSTGPKPSAPTGCATPSRRMSATRAP